MYPPTGPTRSNTSATKTNKHTHITPPIPRLFPLPTDQRTVEPKPPPTKQNKTGFRTQAMDEEVIYKHAMVIWDRDDKASLGGKNIQVGR